MRSGIEIHVVLPFSEEEFKSLSVAPSGGDWLERYESVKKAASAVRYVTNDSYLGDDALFGYASEYALGYSKLRASWLDARICMDQINESCSVDALLAGDAIVSWVRFGSIIRTSFSLPSLKIA